MKIAEEKRDLFSVNLDEYTPAHCISSDLKMGAGIAVPMKKKFKLHEIEENVEDLWALQSPTCLYYNGVLNLITKQRFFSKPTYDSIATALISMKFFAENNNINKIVMPKIGSGLDRLSWKKVKEIIIEIFEDTNIEILVCYL